MRVELTRVGGGTLVVETEGSPAIAEDGGVFAGRVFRAIDEGHLRLSEPVDSLGLADFHLVRDVAERSGVIASEPDPGTCRNCSASLPVDPRGADLETLLAAADDDAPPEGPFELSTPVDEVTAIDMKPTTVADVRAFWRMLTDPDAPLDAAVVRALGLRELGVGERSIDDADAIAEMLMDGSDDLHAVIETLFVELNYPPRLRFPVVCAECGAVHDVPTPSTREMRASARGYDLIFGDASSEDAPDEFPSLEAFAKAVERIADEVFRERDVANLELVVDDDVPPVDAGGEPLMGSYEPIYDGDAAGYTEVRFVITLYVETFRRMFDEAPFDVDAEIRETIDHEVEHHLYHLAGHDPMDEQERREARADLERTFGKERVRRAERRALLDELGSMGRFFFWGLLACGALLLAMWALGLVD